MRDPIAKRTGAGHAAEADAGQGSTSRRLLWFAILWLAGFAAVGAFAFLLRLILL